VAAVAVALFMASLGVAIYTVANQTATLEASDPSDRGALIALVSPWSRQPVSSAWLLAESSPSYTALPLPTACWEQGSYLLAAYTFGTSPYAVPARQR
jgi:hypothetical protein